MILVSNKVQGGKSFWAPITLSATTKVLSAPPPSATGAPVLASDD